MDWLWILALPVAIVLGVYAGIWARKRVRGIAPAVAGAYGHSEADRTRSSHSDWSGDGGDGGGGD